MTHNRKLSDSDIETESDIQIKKKQNKRPKFYFNIPKHFPDRINKLLEDAHFDITTFKDYVIFKQKPESQYIFFEKIFQPQLKTSTTQQIINYSIRSDPYIIVKLKKHLGDIDPKIDETLEVLSKTLDDLLKTNSKKTFNLLNSPEKFDEGMIVLWKSKSRFSDENRRKTFFNFFETYINEKISRFSSMLAQLENVSIADMAKFENPCRVLFTECKQLDILLGKYNGNPQEILDRQKTVYRLMIFLNQIQRNKLLTNIVKKIASIKENDSSALIENKKIEKLTQDINRSMYEKSALDQWEITELENIEKMLDTLIKKKNPEKITQQFKIFQPEDRSKKICDIFLMPKLSLSNDRYVRSDENRLFLYKDENGKIFYLAKNKDNQNKNEFQVFFLNNIEEALKFPHDVPSDYFTPEENEEDIIQKILSITTSERKHTIALKGRIQSAEIDLNISMSPQKARWHG